MEISLKEILQEIGKKSQLPPEKIEYQIKRIMISLLIMRGRQEEDEW